MKQNYRELKSKTNIFLENLSVSDRDAIHLISKNSDMYCAQLALQIKDGVVSLSSLPAFYLKKLFNGLEKIKDVLKASYPDWFKVYEKLADKPAVMEGEGDEVSLSDPVDDLSVRKDASNEFQNESPDKIFNKDNVKKFFDGGTNKVTFKLTDGNDFSISISKDLDIDNVVRDDGVYSDGHDKSFPYNTIKSVYVEAINILENDKMINESRKLLNGWNSFLRENVEETTSPYKNMDDEVQGVFQDNLDRFKGDVRKAFDDTLNDLKDVWEEKEIIKTLFAYGHIQKPEFAREIDSIDESSKQEINPDIKMDDIVEIVKNKLQKANG